MPRISGEEKVREERYKAVRLAKNGQYGRSIQVPVCKRCYEGHRRCPGPELDKNGEWNFSKKCLRCAEASKLVCDFQGPRTRVDLTIHPYRHSTQARRTLTTFDGISPKYKLNEMTEAEKMTTMRAVSQPLSQVQRSDIRKSKTAEKSQPTLQLSASQSSNIQSFEPNHRLLTQPIALHTLEPQAEDDQISHRITQLFEEDPDVADDVLDSANSSKRPLIPNAHHLVELSIPPAMHIDALRQSSLEVAFSQVPQPQPECLLPPRCSSPTYPDPTLHQLTLTTPPKNRGGFLYDGPYPQLEHDWEGEVRMYEDQKKEARRKERKAKLAANPPTYPFASISDQPPSSIGYGKAMGNGGVGTLDYLGIRWESGEKERRGVQDHCIED